MLSRLALVSSNTLRNTVSKNAVPPYGIVRVASTQTPVVKDEKSSQVLPFTEGPERDLVNFPRPKRPLYSGKVRLGFIPEEWFQFFYNKTGVTGPYVFGVGLITYLTSKEIFVLEHEFYSGISLALMAIYAVKKFGPKTAAYADKLIKEEEDQWNNYKNSSLAQFENAIQDELKAQTSAKGQTILFEAKRENVQLQLEAEYRKRLQTVYSEIKRRLDYQLETITARRRLEQQHMVNWIVENVVKGITAQQEKEALQKCISDLKALAAKA